MVEQPTPDGEPVYLETVEEPCWDCDVVQEMDMMRQAYESHPDQHYPKGECPVCGNDHAANPPW